MADFLLGVILCVAGSVSEYAFRFIVIFLLFVMSYHLWFK